MKQLKRILLVEDNQNDIEMTLEALSEYNLANEIVVTRDGAEALDYLYRRSNFKLRSEGNPAVILLDLKMPKVDGFEVLKRLKSTPAVEDIPVAALTVVQKDLVLKDNPDLMSKVVAYWRKDQVTPSEVFQNVEKYLNTHA